LSNVVVSVGDLQTSPLGFSPYGLIVMKETTIDGISWEHSYSGVMGSSLVVHEQLYVCHVRFELGQ
jgi:hypothetical protein